MPAAALFSPCPPSLPRPSQQRIYAEQAFGRSRRPGGRHRVLFAPSFSLVFHCMEVSLYDKMADHVSVSL